MRIDEAVDGAASLKLQRLTSSCHPGNVGECPRVRNPAFLQDLLFGILR